MDGHTVVVVALVVLGIVPITIVALFMGGRLRTKIKHDRLELDVNSDEREDPAGPPMLR